MKPRLTQVFLIKGLLIAGFAFHTSIIISQTSSKVTQYTSENGLSENVVYCIGQDTNGFIWIGTDYGLNRFDGYEFRHYHHDNSDTSSLSDHSILCMERDQQGNFWIGTYNGLNYFNPYNGTANRISLPLEEMNPYITDIVYSEDSLLLFLQQGAGFSYHLKKGATRRLKENEFSLHQRRTNPLHDKNLKIETAINAVEEQNNTFWVGTSRGLYKYPDKEPLVIPEIIIDGRNVSPIIEVRSLFNDEKGNIWIGTFGEGLIRYDTRDFPFKNIPIDAICSNGSRRMIYRLFHWPENTIAVETSSDTYRLIRSGKPESSVSTKNLTPEQVAYIATGKIKAGLTEFQRLSLASINDPFSVILHDDTTIIHAKDGVRLYSSHIQKEIIDKYILHHSADEKFYWLASNQGLIRIDKVTLTDTIYTFEKDQPNSLAEGFLFCVYDDRQGHLWIGTKGGGLNVLHKQENKFQQYNTTHGLPDNVVYSIVPDNRGHLWLSTNKGLSKFDLADHTFTNYSKRDGLINTEFNRLGGVFSADGAIYMAGTAGIDYFRPEDLVSGSSISSIHIAGIKVNGTDKQLNEIATLKYSQNDLIISYSANEFVRPDLIYYRYKLNPNTEWTTVQGIPYASFSRVRPGAYQFEVQSSNDNLHWSTSASVPFKINTPWWATWWFYLLMGAIVTLSFFIFYRYRIRQIKKLATLRSKISRDLHDEVGSTLSSIHVYSGIAAKALGKNTEITEKALNHIRNNSRQVMDNMSDIVWAINNGSQGEGSLEDKLKNYGYELLTPLNINVTYSIDPEAEKKLSHMEARKNVLLIAKEAMNNIARYSKASSARVELQIQNRLLLLTIKDDGNGFNMNTNRKGNGLLNMKGRTEAMGGQFIIQSEEGKGTSLTSSIPITNISNT